MPLREASEVIHVARPQTKRRTAQRPSREGAFGAHLFSDVSTTVSGLRKERPEPWRAPRRRGVGAARALWGNTRVRTLNRNAKVGDRVRATLRVTVRRRGGGRADFGSFGQGTARLATLRNAIEGRNVTAHFTVNTNGTKPPFGWQARAATRSQQGHPRSTPANEAPDCPAAQPRGRLRRSPDQRRQYYSSKALRGAARSGQGPGGRHVGVARVQRD